MTDDDVSDRGTDDGAVPDRDAGDDPVSQRGADDEVAAGRNTDDEVTGAPPETDPATAGGARSEADGPERAPLTAAADASGFDRVRAYWGWLTRAERITAVVVGAGAGLLLLATAVGIVNTSYLVFLVTLAAMYVLLTTSLNVQWGYTGLINFSVAAFFGVGAYTAAVLASPTSPVTAGEGVVAAPLVGVVVAVLAGATLALLIGYPTLDLQDDYLAIATLGLAEVVRIVVRNTPEVTRGTRGLLGMPVMFSGLGRVAAELPVVGGAFAAIPVVPEGVVEVTVAVGLAGGVWLFLRRVHRAPWGRVQRVIRTDEDLAAALGKNTFRLRMESFVLGGAIAALAGVVFVHLNNTVFPTVMNPIQTFYVWIAVILGGSGSDRGAILGGIVLVTILQGTRFVGGGATVRLLVVGLLIIGVMALRQQGVLPPQRELIWPGVGRDE